MTQRDNVQHESEERISEIGHSYTRRTFPASSAAVGALSFFHLGSLAHAESSGSSELGAQPSGSPGDAATRPFHISFPETDLVDLRRRIAATRWPDKEAVADASQGVQLETVQKLAQYWATDYRSLQRRVAVSVQHLALIHLTRANCKGSVPGCQGDWPNSERDQNDAGRVKECFAARRPFDGCCDSLDGICWRRPGRWSLSRYV
jgi:hypothetical protein